MLFSYQYKWELEESKKNILRTHTTAVSTRMLYKLAQEVFTVFLKTEWLFLVKVVGMKYHLERNDNNVFFNALCHFAIHFSIVFEHFFITCLRVLVRVVLSEIFTWHITYNIVKALGKFHVFLFDFMLCFVLFILLLFIHSKNVYLLFGGTSK